MVTLMICGEVERPIELVQRQGPLGPLLRLASPHVDADHATVSSGDGQFRASIPLRWLDDARLDAGRLLIPETPTKCWNVKDVVRIEITVGPRSESAQRG